MGFDSKYHQPRSFMLRLKQDYAPQILGLLNNHMRIPMYLSQGKLVLLSKNKDQAELENIRPIVVKSNETEIL